MVVWSVGLFPFLDTNLNFPGQKLASIKFPIIISPGDHLLEETVKWRIISIRISIWWGFPQKIFRSSPSCPPHLCGSRPFSEKRICCCYKTSMLLKFPLSSWLWADHKENTSFNWCESAWKWLCLSFIIYVGRTSCKHLLANNSLLCWNWGRCQIVLHIFSLHFSSLLCISLHFSEFFCTFLHFSAFHCISLHFTAFLCISLHFTFYNLMERRPVVLWMDAIFTV